MFNLLHCRIELHRKSKDYLQIAIVIYLGALWMLCASSWPLLPKSGILILLLWQLVYIIRHPVPYSRWQALSYKQTAWYLENTQGEELIFDKISIILDTGFSFFLRLSNEKQQKILVIFSDQLSQEEYHQLRVLAKIC